MSALHSEREQLHQRWEELKERIAAERNATEALEERIMNFEKK